MFTRPTLPELVDRIQQDLETRLTLSSPLLRRSVVTVVARVLAGAVHGLYGFLNFLSLQLFPDSSSTNYLERQASVFGIARLAATYATGNVTATGVNGTVIPGGSILQRPDGATYKSAADVTISSGTATLAVTAQSPGLAGNLDAGSALTFAAPVAGAASSASVATGGLAGGTDQETDNGLRTRLLARLQDPPQGGAKNDYIAWAKTVDGVTRVWIYEEELGPGCVTVRFVRDNDGTGSAIIPSGPEVTAVQAAIDPRRPLGAHVTVVAPIADTLNFTVRISPDSTDSRAATVAALQDLITREAQPGGTILLSQIQTAVGSSDDITDFLVSVPAADVPYGAGHLPIIGTVTFV